MEWLLGICTVLGGLSAIWFFWDKISPVIFGRAAKKDEVPAQGNSTQDITHSLNNLYRARLLSAVGSVRLFGNDKSRALDRVFVKLSIAEDYKGPISDHQLMGLLDAGLRRRFSIFAQASREMHDYLPLDGEGRNRRTITPDELLRAGRQAVVTGAPGCGKTTLLKYLAQQTLRNDEDRWVVFIELKAIRTEDLHEYRNLPELLFAKAVAEPSGLAGPDRERFYEEFLGMLRAGRASLYLDGLDEVRHQSLFGDLCSAISEFAGNDLFKHNTLIISTRPFGLHRASLGDLQQLEIQPLDTQQIEDFLHNYYPDDEVTRRLSRELRKPGALRDLARVPVTLAAIIELYRSNDAPELSAGRLGIYEKIVRRLVAKLDQEKNVNYSFFRLDDAEGTLKLDFLQYIAFERLLLDENASETEASRFIFSSEDILTKAKAFVRGEGLQNVSPYTLADDVKATALLREVSENDYAFAHSTIQEYLAAKTLARHQDCERIFCRAYFNAAQVAQEVLPMTLGLVREAGALYEALEHLPESLTFTNLRLRVRGLCYAARISQEKFAKLLDRIVRILIKTPTQEEEAYRRVILNDLWFLTKLAREYLEEKIIPFLADNSGFHKEKAAEALAVVGSEKSFIPLVKALDPQAEGLTISSYIGRYNDSLIDYACRALVKINPQKAVQVLASIRTSYTYGNLHRFLRRVGTEEAFKALLAKRRGIDMMSHYTVEKLIRQSENRKVIDLLVETLRDRSHDVRGMAVDTLGIIGSEDTVMQVAECLRDPHSTVRWKAAHALGYIASDKAVGPLLEALSDQDSAVRWSAAMALRNIPSEKAVDRLVNALSDSNADVRYHAASALGQIGSDRAVEPLIMLLTSDADPKSRSSAAYALSNIKSKKALVPLIECLADPDPQVRTGVAYALGSTYSEEAIGPLTERFGDDVPGVREAVAVALGRIGSEKALPQLIEVLRTDPNAKVREAVLKALGDIDSAEAVGPLMEAHASPFFVHYAAESLSQISVKSLMAALPSLLHHESHYVRRKAALVIGYYTTDQKILAELLRLADNDPIEEVRAAATEGAEKYTRKLEVMGVSAARPEETYSEPRQSFGEPAKNISYTVNIHGHNYGSLQQGGSGNSQNINQASNPIQRNLIELLDAYSSYLRSKLSKVRILGEADERELKEVFVELGVVDQAAPPEHAEFLGLINSAVRQRFNLRIDANKDTSTELSDRLKRGAKRRVRPAELLSRKTKAIVVGAPGSGKTTLLKYLALQAHESDKWLVVWLELKAVNKPLFTYAEKSATRHGTLILLEVWLQHLKAQLSLNSAEIKLLREDLQERLKTHQIAVFLDGFDEVQDGQLERGLNKCVAEFTSASASSPLLISTRPYAQNRLGKERLQELEIEPLDQVRIEAFLNCYYPGDAAAKALLMTLRENSSLRELLHVPLLLGIILRLHREGRYTDKRLKLYETIIADLARELDRSKSIIRQFNISDDRLRSEFLKFLAFERLLQDSLKGGEQESGRIVFSYNVLKEKARVFLALERSPHDPRQLAEDALSTPLLREAGVDAYAFTHLTLQEYLAASYFAELYENDELAALKIFCRAYHNQIVVELEVLPMMLGVTARADSLYDVIKSFSDSLDFVGLRLRMRGLSYNPQISHATLIELFDGLEELLLEKNAGDAPYSDIVANSLLGISGYAEAYAVERMAGLLRHQNNTSKWRVARALGLTRSAAALQPLIDRLSDQQDYVRAIAAEALGRIGDERAVPSLIRALEDTALFVRWNAARSLGNIKSKDAVEPLIRALEDESENYVRGGIADALGDISDERAIDVLSREARQNQEESWHASEALVKIGEKGIAEVLRCIISGDSQIRWDAFTVLPDNMPPEASRVLGEFPMEEGLLQGTPYNCLVEIGENDVAQEVLELGRRVLLGQIDEHEAKAIMRESTKVVPSVLKALQSSESHIRAEAAEVLGIIEDKRAIEPLIIALRDLDSTVRGKAVGALSELKSSLACDALADALADDSGDVRQRAAAAVGTICSGSTEKAIDRLTLFAVKEPNNFIRWNSITSLGQLGGDKATRNLLTVLLFSHQTVDEERAVEALSMIKQSDLRLALESALDVKDMTLISKAAQIVGYYSDDVEVLNKLKALSQRAEDVVVRNIAKGSAEKLFHKLQLLA
jgi:HEAT repeat protein/predicted NACHT family NTPase